MCLAKPKKATCNLTIIKISSLNNVELTLLFKIYWYYLFFQIWVKNNSDKENLLLFLFYRGNYIIFLRELIRLLLKSVCLGLSKPMGTADSAFNWYRRVFYVNVDLCSWCSSKCVIIPVPRISIYSFLPIDSFRQIHSRGRGSIPNCDMQKRIQRHLFPGGKYLCLKCVMAVLPQHCCQVQIKLSSGNLVQQGYFHFFFFFIQLCSSVEAQKFPFVSLTPQYLNEETTSIWPHWTSTKLDCKKLDQWSQQYSFKTKFILTLENRNTVLTGERTSELYCHTAVLNTERNRGSLLIKTAHYMLSILQEQTFTDVFDRQCTRLWLQKNRISNSVVIIF